MLARTEPLRRGPRGQGCDIREVASAKSRSFFLRWITADPSPWGNFTPPMKQECGETLGDLEPVYHLLMITGEITLRELHSTNETRVLRDPGRSWVCLPPAFDYGWNHPATGCDTCQLRQEKNCEKKGAIWNVKRTRTVKEQLDRRCRKTRLKMKHLEQMKETYKVLHLTVPIRRELESKKVQEKAWKGNNEKRKEPYCVPTTIKQLRRLRKSLKRSIWKKLLEMLKGTEPWRRARWTMA